MTISDSINRKIEVALLGIKITSAGTDRVINKVISVDQQDHSDIESEIRTIIEEQVKEIIEENEQIKIAGSLTSTKGDESTKIKKEVSILGDTLDNLKESPFGTMENITRQQVSNLQGFSKDPFKFMLNKFFKKFARGAGIIALATVIFAAVQLIISELFKPGRDLDRRFRRVAKDEILLFNSTEEQAELRQGFRTVTVTTIQFLKGNELRGQISGNLYNPSAIPLNRIDPRRIIEPIVFTQNSSRASRFSNRRNSRFG